MGDTHVPARPDVLTSATGQPNGFVQKIGTAVALAPKAGDQLGVTNHTMTSYSNVGSSVVAGPSGVVEKYNKRFNERTGYYTS